MSARPVLHRCVSAACALPLPAQRAGLCRAGRRRRGLRAAGSRARRFVFPADHGPHPEFRIEWWYVTANLTGRGRHATTACNGRCSARRWRRRRAAGWARPADLVRPCRADHARRPSRRPSGWRAAGSARPASRRSPSRPGSTTGRWRDRACRSVAAAAAAGTDFAYDLELDADGPLVLQGEGGYSVKSEAGQASYYYSQPFYRVDGHADLPRRATVAGDRAGLARPGMVVASR